MILVMQWTSLSYRDGKPGDEILPSGDVSVESHAKIRNRLRPDYFYPKNPIVKVTNPENGRISLARVE